MCSRYVDDLQRAEPIVIQTVMELYDRVMTENINPLVLCEAMVIAGFNLLGATARAAGIPDDESEELLHLFQQKCVASFHSAIHHYSRLVYQDQCMEN